MVERIDIEKMEYVSLGNEKTLYSEMKKRAFDADHKHVVTAKLNKTGKKSFSSVDHLYNRVVSELFEQEREK